MVALKLYESFLGALPYLASSKSSPLFPLQDVTWKQTTTVCAISCSSSLFLSSSECPHFPLLNRSMTLPKSLTPTELPANLTVSALLAPWGVQQLTHSHFYLTLTFSSLERLWKNCSGKKDVLPPQKGNLGIISAVMPQFSKLSLPVLGKKLKTKKKISVYTQLSPTSFSTKFNCLEFYLAKA